MRNINILKILFIFILLFNFSKFSYAALDKHTVKVINHSTENQALCLIKTKAPNGTDATYSVIGPKNQSSTPGGYTLGDPVTFSMETDKKTPITIECIYTGTTPAKGWVALNDIKVEGTITNVPPKTVVCTTKETCQFGQTNGLSLTIELYNAY